MKIKLIVILSFCLFYLGTLVFDIPRNPFVEKAKSETIGACPAQTELFPSYNENFKIDDGFCQNGNVPFKLRQDYPKVKPSPENLPWTTIVQNKKDFNETNWKDYLKEILKYSYENNLENKWIVEKNTKRDWYHAPWMHYGGKGREYVHGMTKERRACLSVLMGARVCGKDEPRTIQNWAVSFYNEPGGYYIGKVWEEMYKPNPNPANFPKEGFPEGTVVIKLLFTDAIDLPIVKGSIEWKPDINEEADDENSRKRKKMRLLQIDIAVRERPDVAPNGWIFGTFVYDANNKSPLPYPEELKPEKGWLKMVPIGLMYGNKQGESFKAYKEADLPFGQHHGCNQYEKNGQLIEGEARLNGPIDNPISSCLACHAEAETTKTTLLSNKSYKISFVNHLNEKPLPCENAIQNKFLFKNINPRSSDESERTLSIKPSPSPTEKVEYFSLDYSLQLRNGIENYCRTVGANKCNSTSNNKNTLILR